MDKYYIAVCDDEIHDRARLINLLNKNPYCPEKLIIYEYESGEELLENYRGFDAVFMDISMDVMNGREAAHAVRQMDTSVLLAFYTGMDEYASQIVPIHPFIFLDKRDEDEVLSENLNDLMNEMQRRHRTPRLQVKCDGCLLLLEPSDIIYITIRGKGSELWLTKLASDRLHMDGNSVQSHTRLPVYYQQLQEYGFVYAHRSYIVNVEYVMMRNKNTIVLENGYALNIARSKQKGFDRELSAYLGICYKRGERP